LYEAIPFGDPVGLAAKTSVQRIYKLKLKLSKIGFQLLELSACDLAAPGYTGDGSISSASVATPARLSPHIGKCNALFTVLAGPATAASSPPAGSSPSGLIGFSADFSIVGVAPLASPPPTTLVAALLSWSRRVVVFNLFGHDRNPQ